MSKPRQQYGDQVAGPWTPNAINKFERALTTIGCESHLAGNCEQVFTTVAQGLSPGNEYRAPLNEELLRRNAEETFDPTGNGIFGPDDLENAKSSAIAKCVNSQGFSGSIRP